MDINKKIDVAMFIVKGTIIVCNSFYLKWYTFIEYC
jgi:hypothetical protein